MNQSGDLGKPNSAMENSAKKQAIFWTTDNRPTPKNMIAQGWLGETSLFERQHAETHF